MRAHYYASLWSLLAFIVLVSASPRPPNTIGGRRLSNLSQPKAQFATLQETKDVSKALLTKGGAAVAKKSPTTPPATTTTGKPPLSLLYTAFIVAVLAVAYPIFYSSAFQDQLVKPVHASIPLSWYQVLIPAATLVNQLAVRVPGRSDGSSWRKITGIRFFTPSGYAFAIWAPIFLGENILSLYQFALPWASKELAASNAPAKFASFFAAALTSQSLWCLAFRPWSAGYQYLPSALLALTAVSLFRAHGALRAAAAEGLLKIWDYPLIHFPISLHFGWMTAATLVNLNGWFAVAPIRTGDKLALAHNSVHTAVLVGTLMTLWTTDPLYSLVIAWALYAVAYDLLPANSYLRKDKSVPDVALDSLESTARAGAALQGLVSLGMTVWKLATWLLK